MGACRLLVTLWIRGGVQIFLTCTIFFSTGAPSEATPDSRRSIIFRSP